jgi:hypothetical protein
MANVPARRTTATSASTTGRFSADFLEFWNVYPRKQAKLDAWKAYQEALKSAEPETILVGARAYALLKIGEDKNFLKLPAGWLRGERWDDEQFAPPSDKLSGIVNLLELGRTFSSDAWMQPGAVTPAIDRHNVTRFCPLHEGYPDNPCARCARDAEGDVA